MPISAIIEQDLVTSVQGSSVQGTDGIWINADVKVFIPLGILEKCNEQAVSFSLSQEAANILFDEVLRLRMLKPGTFNDWETRFIDDLAIKLKEGLKLSPKQLSKVKIIYESSSAGLSNLDNIENELTNQIMDDIPF